MTMREGPRRRGVFLLPTAFTLGNIFCGFASIIASSDGLFERAAFLIIIAVVLDGLDGRVARWAHATSPFGLQLDSLADLVSFGVAPAVLLYGWGLRELGRLGWVSAFLFVICGAIRLARFNVLTASADNRYFVGLPIPVAAGAVAALVFWHPGAVLESRVSALVVLLAFGLSFLMVSTFRYLSFKKLDFKRRRAVTTLLWMVLVLCLLVIEPAAVLLTAATLYVMSAPVIRLTTARRVRASRHEPDILTDEPPPDA